MGPTYQSSPTSSPLPPPVPPRGDSAAAGRVPTPCIGDARRTCGWPRHPYLHPQRCFAGCGSLPMPCTSTALIPYKLANGLTTPTSVPQMPCRRPQVATNAMHIKDAGDAFFGGQSRNREEARSGGNPHIGALGPQWPYHYSLHTDAEVWMGDATYRDTCGGKEGRRRWP
jgi:hypothetical protein